MDKVKAVEDAEVGDLSRFFPSSKRPAAEMLAELDAWIASVRDPWIRRLLEALLVADGARRAAFAKAPAAKSMHHAFLGGLLEHSLSIAVLADRACAHYTELNRDLVLAGVFLHDLGKTAELTYARSFGYSDEGNLIGHISMEAQWIQRAIEALPGFPEALRLHLLHIVLSHHGRLEYGSPVLPKTPEALVVHMLDDLDGKLEVIFRTIREDAGEGAWTPYQRALDRTLFKGRWPRVD
jgi:3'-5' exoribonuclease